MSAGLKVFIIIAVIILISAIGFISLKIYSDNHVLDKTGMIYSASDIQSSNENSLN